MIEMIDSWIEGDVKVQYYYIFRYYNNGVCSLNCLQHMITRFCILVKGLIFLTGQATDQLMLNG